MAAGQRNGRCRAQPLLLLALHIQPRYMRYLNSATCYIMAFVKRNSATLWPLPSTTLLHHRHCPAQPATLSPLAVHLCYLIVIGSANRPQLVMGNQRGTILSHHGSIGWMAMQQCTSCMVGAQPLPHKRYRNSRGAPQQGTVERVCVCPCVCGHSYTAHIAPNLRPVLAQRRRDPAPMCRRERERERGGERKRGREGGEDDGSVQRAATHFTTWHQRRG